jgi:hypothetical protein
MLSSMVSERKDKTRANQNCGEKSQRTTYISLSPTFICNPLTTSRCGAACPRSLAKRRGATVPYDMQHESPFSVPGTPDQNQVSVAFVQIWLRHCPLGLRLAASQVKNNRKGLAAEHVSGSDFQLLGPLGLAEVDFVSRFKGCLAQRRVLQQYYILVTS